MKERALSDAARVDRVKRELARLAALPPSAWRDAELQAGFRALADAERRGQRKG